MRYIIEVIHERADGALIERYIIRSRVTGLAHSPIMFDRKEAEYWLGVFNQAAVDKLHEHSER